MRPYAHPKMRPWPSTSRVVLRSLRKALSLAVAMVLFAALLGAGVRRLYCMETGTVLDGPCCMAKGHSPSDDVAQLRDGHSDCCGVLAAPNLPSSITSGESPSAPPPSVVGVLPAAPTGGQALATSRAAIASRMCGPPPAPSEARARLMVFLI